MGMFRRRKDPDGRDATADTDTHDDGQSTASPPDELTEKAQEVMSDNLEMMRDLVFRIRDDPEFAKGIYKDCPRLQHLMNRYPDLRPIFEDPKLVRINFEQVYREAGGILPEDEVDKKKKSWLVWLVNSPIFKVLKLLLFVKKLMACIAGGGIAMITGCFVGCCFEDALDEIDAADGDGDADGDDADGEASDPNKDALNRAADHMEDPDVQEQMEALLEDPDNMEEAIANDSDLQALRESNPLCDELMNDPETMRVLTDPDNLRALGEAPSLIEADFIDPDSFLPEDIETGGFDSAGADGFDGLGEAADAEFGDTDADFEYDVDGDADDGFDGEAEAEPEAEAEGDGEGDGEGEGEEEEEDGWWDDAELEEQENPDSADANTANKGKAQKGKQGAAAAAATEGGKGGGFKGIMASVGVAATELIAAQVVGQIFDVGGMGDLMAGGGGGDLGGIDAVGDDVGDVVNDDVADVAEDAVDETDEQAKDGEDGEKGDGPDADMDDDGKKKNNNAGAVAGGAAGGAAVGGAAGVAMSGDGENRARGEGEGEGEGEDTFEDEEEPEEEKKKSRFGFIGSFAGTLATAAKEHIATAILGDDFGEALVERMEEKDEDEDSKKEGQEGEDSGEEEEEEEEEEKPKKRGFFRRNKA